MRITDQELFASMAQRRTDALAEIYDRHSRLLFGVILGLVRETEQAEDILQEVMLQIWSNAASYRPELGSPKGWMVCIARNRAINVLRSRRHRQSRVEIPLPDEHEGSLLPSELHEESTWEVVTREEQSRLIGSALDGLPESQRSLIEMAFLDGFSHSEIAEKTSIPLGTVKTRIRNGLLTLRTRMNELAGPGGASV